MTKEDHKWVESRIYIVSPQYRDEIFSLIAYAYHQGKIGLPLAPPDDAVITNIREEK